MTHMSAPAALAVLTIASLAPHAASAATVQGDPIHPLQHIFAERTSLVHTASLDQAAGEEAEKPAIRDVVARVDISDQRMYVYVNGELSETFTVSTAGRGYVTPTGSWKPYRMHTMWHSRKYNNAPMPHSIFFHEGYAVHATDQLKRLGTPASHGCVRLHPDDATKLFSMVLEAGRANTEIVITQ